jgi:hypothetical protein
MMQMLKKILVRFLLISCGLLLALLAIELGVRVLHLYTFPADDFVEPHPELGWSHTPNKEGSWIVGKNRIHVKINSKGLRDREYPYNKKEGTFRILVLGDSFTEAFQVPLENTFPKVLEYELNKVRGGFEVINAGFGGVGTDYELLFFRREGHKYHPDLVIIAFSPNDVYDNYRSKEILDSKRSPLAYEKRGLVVSLKQFLAKKSCAYNYFGVIIPQNMPLLANLLMRFGLLSFQPIDDVQGGSQLHVFAKECGPRWKKAWDVTRMVTQELKKEAENHGSRLALISIPLKEQVYPRLWRSLLSHPTMRNGEWDLNKPDRILSEFLSDTQIPFLPLLPHFRKAGKKSELYCRVDKDGKDGHWNVEGHRLAGQVICSWLVKQKLVPIQGETRK